MTNLRNPIGIFDSGMGGISVLKEATKMLPKESFIYYGDGKNIPYGTKSIQELIELSDTICDYLIQKHHVKAIVIACNTATSAAVTYLREKYDIPIIGMEPAIKPAVTTCYGGKIGVLGTPVTLREEKFQNLASLYNKNTTIVELPAPNLVHLVERGIVDGDEAKVEILKSLNGYEKDLDAIVLGCTHFVFLKKYMQLILGKHIQIFDGNKGTIRNLEQILKEKDQLCDDYNGLIEIINSAGQVFVNLSWQLYNL